MGSGDADAQLMLRYAAGARAFDGLYANHRNGLWRFIRRSVRDAAATDDVFQECWSRVIAHRGDYRPEARFATWLYRIAHNCCMDHWRKTGRRGVRETADDEAVAAAADDDATEPLDAVLAGERGERLAAALERLPKEQGTAFLLYVEGGLSVAEIAESTGVNPETAMSRLRLLALHSTVKPVAMVQDIILDCTARRDIVLDPFLGSGTTVIAAQRSGRHCAGIELDPKYVDTAIRRWERFTGDHAMLVATGETFAHLADSRSAS